MQLPIPESIVQSIRLPENRLESKLLKQLAVALHGQDLLSFGKVRELANLDHRQFSQLLGDRGLPRHCTETELAEDLDYVCHQ